ncbi:MAG TPA: hypothetical protein VFI61_00055 [Patescibacteria group bacterium]|nr:hypothetical protein [Patescibacteria group bacterium]
MNTLAQNINSSFNSPLGDLNKVSSLVTLFLNASFVLAGLILLFFFILGGIGMIGSAGKNDPKSLEQAKHTITSALIGFIVVFTSYWIVKLIGQLIGMPNLL